MTGLLNSDAVQAELTLRDRGLARRTLIAGGEPKVEPRDLTVTLPEGIEYGTAWGDPEQFIAYLRGVHTIPTEATQDIEMEHDLGQSRIRYRVTWRWWVITAPIREDIRP